MKVLFFAGSLRQDSLNKKLAREAMRLMKTTQPEIESTFLDLKDFPMVIYDGDVETKSGIPETTTKLGRLIRDANAMVISTPEYNGSISGIMKNVIDWLSREKPHCLGGKHLLLLAASPGALGGVRGLWHSRIPFEALGVHVFPTMMGLSSAGDKFDTAGKLKDDKFEQGLAKLLQDFTKVIR